MARLTKYSFHHSNSLHVASPGKKVITDSQRSLDLDLVGSVPQLDYVNKPWDVSRCDGSDKEHKEGISYQRTYVQTSRRCLLEQNREALGELGHTPAVILQTAKAVHFANNEKANNQEVTECRSVRQTPSRQAKRTVRYEVYEDDDRSETHEIGNHDADCYQSSDETETSDEDSIALIEFWSQRHPIPNGKNRRTRSAKPSGTRSSAENEVVVEVGDEEMLPGKSCGPQRFDESMSSGRRRTPQNICHSTKQPAKTPQKRKGSTVKESNELPNTRPSKSEVLVSRATTPTLETPPQTLGKAVLRSPTRSNKKVPDSPFRPSLDAFWSASVINEWNDQFSVPKKLQISPGKVLFPQTSGEGNGTFNELQVFKAPKNSPEKQSPSKAKLRKDFEARKQILAERFLKQLDERMTCGKIACLTESSGGVRLKWSKTLNKTAGRASWRRELNRNPTPGADGASSSATYRHVASIELAEKVIDDEHKLVNTLAHEFCHLVTFMISGVKDNPHGTDFKRWGAKATDLFADRGVCVTTRHSYEIDYKYIWSCTVCSLEYKRHSKSIDVDKQACGTCKSRLVQIKPAVRSVKLSSYQLFVKENYRKVKDNTLTGGHAAVMEVLGRMYKEAKAADQPKVNSGGKTQDVEVLASVFDTLRVNE